MLDAFAAVLVQNDTQRSVEDELTAEFLKLGSAEEVQKVASMLDCVKSPCDPSDYSWLSQYEGTPLYEQATALEEQSLDIESQRVQYDLQQAQERQTRPDFWAQSDLIRLKKKMLDLDLAKLKNGDAGTPAAPVPDESAAPPAAPPPVAPAKEAAFKPGVEHFKALGLNDKDAASMAAGWPAGLNQKDQESFHAAWKKKGMTGEAKTASVKEAFGLMSMVAPTPEEKYNRSLGGRIRNFAAGKPGALLGNPKAAAPKVASAGYVDLAGRALAHAFYKEAKSSEEEKSRYNARAVLGTTGFMGGAGLGAAGGALAQHALHRLGVPVAPDALPVAGIVGGAALGGLGGLRAGSHISPISPEAEAQRAPREQANEKSLGLWLIPAGAVAGGELGAGGAYALGKKMGLPEKTNVGLMAGGGLVGTAAGAAGGFLAKRGLTGSKPKDKTAAPLTQAGREEIKPKNFAIPKGNGPGDTGKYPIQDSAHASAALNRVSQFGSPAEKAKVHAAVVKKYPALAARSSVPAVREKAEKEKAASVAMREAALKLGIEKKALMQYLNPITAVPALAAKGLQTFGKGMGGSVGKAVQGVGNAAGKLTNFNSGAGQTLAKFL